MIRKIFFLDTEKYRVEKNVSSTIEILSFETINLRLVPFKERIKAKDETRRKMQRSEEFESL